MRAALTGGDFAGRLRRGVRGLLSFVDLAGVDVRLARLHRAGVIERVPTRWQLAGGVVDMLRFYVIPTADRYARDEAQASLAFYELVRFISEPATVIDPIGVFTARDMLVRHVMQVHHFNPAFDLQLLQMYDDGIDELERQLDEVLAGTHPRTSTILGLVEEPDYPGKLRAYLRDYRRDPTLSFDRDPKAGTDAERTFATLAMVVRYMNRLPSAPLGIARHLATTKTLPPHLAEPRQPDRDDAVSASRARQ